jgi:UDP-N-acetylmuramoylalanine--D-glutamate ligase
MLLKGKKVLVLGMGVSGVAAAHLLKDEKAIVTIAEIENSRDKRAETKKLSEEGMEVVLGSHPLSLLEGKQLIIISPGIPLTIPLLQKARLRSIPILGELELAFRFLKGKSLVAITGTNGKTTTTLLTGKILEKAGKDVQIAGNVGIPLAKIARGKSEIIVAEVSTFQLETIDKFSPYISCILNISTDHLDRHLSLENYSDLKARIFLNQKNKDFTVLNRDDARVYPLASKTKAQVIFVSKKDDLKKGVFLQNARIKRRFNKEEEIVSYKELTFAGSHNLENILSSIAIASLYGVEAEIIREALIEFKGLPHRVEWVGEVKGVEFINDSKATNEDAVRSSLKFRSKKTILIMGGKDKGADFSSLKKVVGEKVRKLILLGEAKRNIRNQLNGICPIEEVEDMREAVRQAFKDARRGDSVLLSPGCASFDQFKDYKERGEVFKREVKKLQESDEAY